MSNIALVTGGSAGIGLSIAKALTKEGFQVVATSRDASKCEILEGITYVDLELQNKNDLHQWVDEFVTRFGVPTLLINNAGFGSFHKWEDFPVEDITAQLSVMLESPILLCRYFAPLMQQIGGGYIVNISSLAGQYPLPYMPAYNTAKGGLSAFTRTLMLEYANSPLHVIDFRPGDFNTRFNEVLSKTGLEDPQFARVWENIDKHLKHAPHVSVASKDLIKAIQRKKSGIVYTGDFIQSKLGPIFYKMVPDSWILKFIQLYYKM